LDALAALISGSPIERYLQELHTRYAALSEGDVADYIPELAKADRNWFGICIATRDGHVYEVGDTRQAFTIQSISKALSYGLALQDRGEDYILARIGVEPSGEAFNAISLKPETGAPFNPMINAGAIATCGQILDKDGCSRIQRILAYLSACAGRQLDVNQQVYQSESDTGHRNRAIGWMLRNFGILGEEPTEILETYFQQCAIQVNCRDLALMGATLANQGRNPLTREQAVDPDVVDNVLSVMSTCGMYDYSGEWIYRVGLPAKSGVGGGILAVLPGQLGIGIFSPPLDAQGNSARGIKVCGDLSRDLALHLFANGSAPTPALRLSYTGSQVTSSRRRPHTVQQTLRGSGHRIRVHELQGELIFSTLEPLVRIALKQAPYCQYLVINLRNVVNIDDVALKLLIDLRGSLGVQGVRMVICCAGSFASRLRKAGFPEEALFDDDDAALERCENALLTEVSGTGWIGARAVGLSDIALLSGLNGSDLAMLDAEMPVRSAPAGDYLMRAGDAGDSIYLLMSGSVEVRLPSDSGGKGSRLDVFEAGMSFGEMGLLDGAPRSADVMALEPVTFRVIDRVLFDRLGCDRPDIKIRMLEQIARQLSSNLRKANTEAAAYKG
jgi:glutaminase